jgi:single-stranded-DNA-specific exonuclease
MAAGFSVPTERLPELKTRLLDQLHEIFPGVMPVPKLHIDALVDFRHLDERLLLFFDRLEPFGMGNPRPLFATMGVDVLDRRAVGAGNKHLKLTVSQAGRVFDAIAFNQGELYSRTGGAVDLVFHFERNHYRGVTTMQLNIQDIRF